MTYTTTNSAPTGEDGGSASSTLSRREAIARGVSATSAGLTTLAFASVPLALAAFSRRLLAQAPTTVRGALEFAYLLENLESEFYKAVLGQSATEAQNLAFAPVRAQLQNDPSVIATLQQIAKHEAAHVAFLRAQITALGGAPATYTGAEFDFTGGNGRTAPGPFAAARADVPTLLILAQLLEDTGVRAYKGQLENLMADDAVLTAAMRIQSVEGRHAARIRRLRNVTGLKPWISSTATSTTTGITTSGAVTAAVAQLGATSTGFSRASGTFTSEGFAVGQEITAAGFANPANNGVFVVSAVPAPVTTGSTSLSATATGYARASGSFVTNGFVVGQEITASGFTNAANNGRSTITAVTATTITVNKATPTVAEEAATGRSLVADAVIRVTRPGSAAGVVEAPASGRFLVASRGVAPAASTLVTRVYVRETNSIHGGIDMAGLGSNTGGVTGVTEAFDEPLTYDDVIFIIENFVIGSTP